MPRKGKRTDLAQWIEEHRPPVIGEPEWVEIQQTLAPISRSYLRKLLRETDVPLRPMIEGVRQESLESLEASLLALLNEYADQPREVRRMVIEAKDHAKWAVKENPAKAEMVLWMLTWLENPPLFPDWVALRKTAGLRNINGQ